MSRCHLPPDYYVGYIVNGWPAAKPEMGVWLYEYTLKKKERFFEVPKDYLKPLRGRLLEQFKLDPAWLVHFEEIQLDLAGNQTVVRELPSDLKLWQNGNKSPMKWL